MSINPTSFINPIIMAPIAPRAPAAPSELTMGSGTTNVIDVEAQHKKAEEAGKLLANDILTAMAPIAPIAPAAPEAPSAPSAPSAPDVPTATAAPEMAPPPPSAPDASKPTNYRAAPIGGYTSVKATSGLDAFKKVDFDALKRKKEVEKKALLAESESRKNAASAAKEAASIAAVKPPQVFKGQVVRISSPADIIPVLEASTKSHSQVIYVSDYDGCWTKLPTKDEIAALKADPKNKSKIIPPMFPRDPVSMEKLLKHLDSTGLMCAVLTGDGTKTGGMKNLMKHNLPEGSIYADYAKTPFAKTFPMNKHVKKEGDVTKLSDMWQVKLSNGNLGYLADGCIGGRTAEDKGSALELIMERSSTGNAIATDKKKKQLVILDDSLVNVMNFLALDIKDVDVVVCYYEGTKSYEGIGLTEEGYKKASELFGISEAVLREQFGQSQVKQTNRTYIAASNSVATASGTYYNNDTQKSLEIKAKEDAEIADLENKATIAKVAGKSADAAALEAEANAKRLAQAARIEAALNKVEAEKAALLEPLIKATEDAEIVEIENKAKSARAAGNLTEAAACDAIASYKRSAQAARIEAASKKAATQPSSTASQTSGTASK